MFGGGGFGGDAGNQFAGGGFMPSQANEGGYGGGGSGGAKSGNKTAQTLRTLTIRQLAKDLANSDDENFIVDGVEVANLTVLGKITGVQDRNANLAITINDGTGELELHHWLTDDEAANAEKRAELRPGIYVKAHGHLKLNADKAKGVVLSAFAVRPITNYNELTYHYLRAIFEHLHLTKGGPGTGQQTGMGAPGGGFGAPAAGGWPQQQQQPMHAAGGATAFAGAAGVDPCQGAVLQIIQASNAEQGVNQTEVYNRLGGQFNRQAIDNALQSLMAEAHVYNTVDDNHWKAA